MDFITDVLEPYEAAVDAAISAKSHRQSAQTVLNASTSLAAAAEAVNEVLPDELRLGPVLSDEQSTALLAIVGSVAQSEELRSKREEVEAALKVASLIGIDEETQTRAKVAVNKHTTELQVVQEKGGKGKGGDARNMKHTIAASGPDMNRTSPKGDWTSIRWQLNEHANKGHNGIASEALDATLTQLKRVDAGEVPSVEVSLIAGDGTEYKVLYPAA